MGEDEKKEEEKKGELTVDHIGTHVIDPNGPDHPIPVHGQANPGDHVVITNSWSDEVQHAQAGPDGHYGGTFKKPPDKPGVNTVSVASSGQTTETTFPSQ